jgi:glycine cleavage system transcriptional repressor
VADRLELMVVVRPVDPAAPLARAGRAVQVTVHGVDRPGIVHRVASVCARHGGNVVDLATRVVGDAERPVYVMLLELDVPEAVVLDMLAADLGVVAQELDVDVVVRDVESDVL